MKRDGLSKVSAIGRQPVSLGAQYYHNATGLWKR